MTRCCCFAMWRRKAALALNGTARVRVSGKEPPSYAAQLPTPIGPIRATRCLEGRTGNVGRASGGRQVFGAVAKTDTDLAGLMRRSLDAVGRTEGTALTAFTD